MAWIVTSWRNEALTVAAREVADADAYLAALERFGVDTRGEVRRQRLELRADGPGATTVRAARKPARARLRESPLSELFRATAEQ